MVTDRRSLLVGVALGVLVTGCGDASRAAAPAAAAVVQVVSVVERDVPISAEWVGTLIGYVDAQIRARVSGHLFSLNYKEGSLVKRGDLLFQVDPRPYQTALDQAGAKLRLAESNAGQAKAQVSASQAQVEQARASVAQAEATSQGGGRPRSSTELDVGRYTPAAARVREPAGAGQRGADQPREPGRRRGRARRAAELAASVAQARRRSRRRAPTSKTQAGERRRGPRRPRGRAAEPRLHAVARADRRHRRVPRREHRRPRRPERQPAADDVSQVDPIYAEVPISEQLAYSVFRHGPTILLRPASSSWS
jgi:multidrug resistance efflux pump